MVRIFPNGDLYIRLVITYLVEYAADWSVSSRPSAVKGFQ